MPWVPPSFSLLYNWGVDAEPVPTLVEIEVCLIEGESKGKVLSCDVAHASCGYTGIEVMDGGVVRTLILLLWGKFRAAGGACGREIHWYL